MKELPSAGGELLKPVVQVISVALLELIIHSMPSIKTESEEPKFVPVIVIESPPTEGPNDLEISVTVEVAAALYTTLSARLILY